MNKMLLWVVMLLCSTFSYAQAPQALNFQAVARDAQENVLSEKTVAIKVEVLQGSISGSVVYGETHRLTTAKNGVVNLQIGKGTAVSGSFPGIDWSQSPYFFRIGMDTNGGSSYKEVAVSQMLSVPYALYAAKAGSAESVDNAGSSEEEAPQFIVLPLDRSDAKYLTGLENENGSYMPNFFISYLNGENQDVQYEIKGLPAGVSVIDNSSASGPYGKYINFSINWGEVADGTYSFNIVLKSKYGATKSYPFKYVWSKPGDIAPGPDDFWTEELKKEMLSAYQDFANLNKAMDNAFMGKSEDETYAEFKNKTYNSSSSLIFTYYGNAYKVIRRANIALEGMANATSVSSETRQAVTDQAKAIRAYTYLMLVQWFGDIPLVTKVLTINDDLYLPRTPKTEVLASVIQDLKDASIKTKSVSRESDVTDITIEEMHILLREAYLLQGEWGNAKTLGGLEQDIKIRSENSTIVDFIKKIADWKLNATESVDEASLMDEYMNTFHSIYNQGNLYLNILNYSTTYFNEMDAYRALLPIPERELTLNPNMIQNPGY